MRDFSKSLMVKNSCKTTNWKLVKKLSDKDYDIWQDFEGYYAQVKDGKVIKGGFLDVNGAISGTGRRATQI